MMIQIVQKSWSIFLSLIKTFYITHFYRRVIIGKGTIVFYKSDIIVRTKNVKVEIGNNCRLGCSKLYYHGGMPFYSKILVEGENTCVTVGDNTRINGAYIHAKKHISIGSNCVIAAGVNIVDSNSHVVHSINRTKGFDSPQNIEIGNNVWICMNSIILKGTRIGDNSIVSAGSIAKGDYPPNSIITGNPAIVIKTIDIENAVANCDSAV